MNPISLLLCAAAIMFCVGAVGAMVRRGAIVVFMCVGLMLNAVNVTFVAFSAHVGNLDGQIAVLLSMAVAAAEAAVGLAIIISLFRATKSVETSDVAELRL